ncbi:MAG: hypothetical protein M1308_10390 [Actinobacteria bacterium]|nr:hypothetical protein [Actinomycetota bacterium]
MTHRERIIAALNHKESDRVPVDLGSTESTGITWIVYNKLKKYFGIQTKTQVFDLMQLIAKVERSVTKAVGSDAVSLLIEPKFWKDWEFKKDHVVEVPAKVNLKKLENGDMVTIDSGGAILSRLPKGGYYFDSVFHPLKNNNSLSGIETPIVKEFFKSFDWPQYNDENFSDLKFKAEKLSVETDYAIVGNLWVHLLASAQDLRGFENFMMDLIVNKKLAHKIFEKQLEAYIPRIDRYIEAVGKYVQIIQVNDDLGTQNSLQMSADLYREMVKPYHKRLWKHIKNKSKKPLLLHSCGSIFQLIPDLIEMEVDALNPIQVSAANMDTKKLKKEFGKDITFWGGGCDTQKVLPYGTEKDVREEVKRRVDDLSSGGGFVFCQVHNIQPDVPVKNILAMYETLIDI